MTRRFALATIVAALLAGCAAPKPISLKVMSYNIHHGEGLDGRLDLERIARVIRDSGADLVSLQEVDKGTRRTGRIDQPARLAELTGMTAIFEKNIEFEGGEYGNAILSRLPVERHENRPLPSLTAGEQRGALVAVVGIAGTKLVFCATHFDYRRDDAERLASVPVMKKIVEDHAGLPVIVAGDLNTEPTGPVLPRLLEFLSDTCPAGATASSTFPASRPDRRIDYILHTPHAGPKPVDFRVVDEAIASDHRPILATVSFSGRAR